MERGWVGLLVGLLVGAVTGWVAHGLVGPDPAASPEPAETPVAAPEVELGRQVYDRSCSVCHTLRPPPALAPPVVGLVDHYRDRFEDPDSAMAHIVDFVRDPAKEKSALPPEVWDRWELMPPMPLPEEDLRAVARWMWAQYDSTFTHPGRRNRPGAGS